MARLILFALMVAVIVAIVMIMLSALRGLSRSGQRAQTAVFGPVDGGPMAPNGVQKIAYVALLVLLLGVGSGWLGGL
jgi:hypothetical protein